MLAIVCGTEAHKPLMSSTTKDHFDVLTLETKFTKLKNGRRI
jgi:hypothetical protein